MDTIATHSRKLVIPYKRGRDSELIIASAKRLALLILCNDKLLLKHRKKALDNALWYISEVDGKYSTRYRSAEVVRLAKQDPCSKVKIQHEHVFTRKQTITKLIENQDYYIENKDVLGSLLEQTTGCVVTESEHAKLDKHAIGWKRYDGIAVLDMSTEPPSTKIYNPEFD